MLRKKPFMNRAQARISGAIVGLAIAFAGFGATANGQPLPADPIPVSGAYDPAFAALDTDITDWMTSNSVSAVVVAVMFNSRVMYERGFGWRNTRTGDLTPVAENDVIRVASVTKPFTAMAIQRLVADNVINWADRVFDYNQPDPDGGILPANPYSPYNGTLGDSRLVDITLEDLLLHRGGWDVNSNAAPWNGLSYDPQFSGIQIADEIGLSGTAPGAVNTVRFMLSQPLQYTPGSPTNLCTSNGEAGTHCYSNFGYMLLGLIIEEVTGQDYMDYIYTNFVADWGIGPKEILQGRSLETDQDPREPLYYTGNANWNNVFDGGATQVYGPYGGWEQEIFLGHGDLVTNTVTLLNFISRYAGYTDYWFGSDLQIGQTYTTLPSNGWGHLGSLPGTNAWARQDTDGLRIAIIVNRRDSGGGTDFCSDLSTLVRNHVYAGGFTWPTRYATDNWVDFSLNINGIGVYLSPMKDIPDVLPIVQTGGRIKMKPGTSSWTGTITQAVKLDAPLGTALIGQQ